MTEPLPWDDPNRDIRADMRSVLADLDAATAEAFRANPIIAAWVAEDKVQ